VKNGQSSKGARIKPQRDSSNLFFNSTRRVLENLRLPRFYLLSRTLISKQKEMAMTYTGNGIIDVPTLHSIDETVDKLKTILIEKGVTLFALIDHSGEAAKAGLVMRPTKLLIFGSPRAGTPLMLATPSIAIDLPLKILIWEDDRENVWLSFNSPEYLANRHNLPGELLQNIGVVAALAAQAAE
jgi:uncharacterized protein (DUF302 family)